MRVGVSASHLVERFDFVDAETTFIVKLTDPTQQPTVVRGKMTSQTYNRLTTFDIPIQVGFQTLNERSDWNFAVYTGVLLNLDFKSSGKMTGRGEASGVSHLRDAELPFAEELSGGL